MSVRRIVLAVLVATFASACAQDRVVLLPGEDGAPTGAVAVLTEKGETAAIINRPYTDAKVGSDSAETRSTDAATIDRELGVLIATLPRKPRSFLLYFREGTTELMPQSRPVLQQIFTEVAARPGVDVQVIGHTSTLGSMRNNDRLSIARAKEIAELLIKQGLNRSMVLAVGRGERELLVQTGDGVRNASNRRVEVLVR